MARFSIETVTGKAGEKEFLTVPFEIFKDDPNWIAPLFLERLEHISRTKNPYFEHAEAKLFVAKAADGRLLGRISAQIDRLLVETRGAKVGQFGFFDCIDDQQVADALITAARDWLKNNGMDEIEGPYSFSINHEVGLLVKGFDRPPRFLMGHARPYYGGLLEKAGLAKAKDLIAYDYDATQDFPPAVQRMVDRAKASGNLVLRPIRKKHLKQDLDLIIDIFNDAWSENWGFVPMTPKEIDHLGASLKHIVSEGFIVLASWKGEYAAMGITLPDVNQWISGLNGRLLPFGWIKVLNALFRPPVAIRLPLMGVRKKYHPSPRSAILAIAIIGAVRDYHVARGTTRAELSWILEDNVAMRRVIESLGVDPYKLYRVYSAPL